MTRVLDHDLALSRAHRDLCALIIELNHLIIATMNLLSMLLPTSKNGVSGQWCVISDSVRNQKDEYYCYLPLHHFVLMFASDEGCPIENIRRKTYRSISYLQSISYFVHLLEDKPTSVVYRTLLDLLNVLVTKL